MKKAVLSTHKILKTKAFNADIDESWIQWAVQMMQAGFEADSLYELAGISKPFNQFELQELTTKVLKDLELDYSDKKKILRNYTYFLIKSCMDIPDKYDETLKELRDSYYENDTDTTLQNMALLYWAKEELQYDEHQYYWEGADRTNIDRIIYDQFTKYIHEFENGR